MDYPVDTQMALCRVAYYQGYVCVLLVVAQGWSNKDFFQVERWQNCFSRRPTASIVLSPAFRERSVGLIFSSSSASYF